MALGKRRDMAALQSTQSASTMGCAVTRGYGMGAMHWILVLHRLEGRSAREALGPHFLHRHRHNPPASYHQIKTRGERASACVPHNATVQRSVGLRRSA